MIKGDSLKEYLYKNFLVMEGHKVKGEDVLRTFDVLCFQKEGFISIGVELATLCPNLENIDLSYNKLQTVEGIRRLVKLKSLILENNDLATLSNLTSLPLLQILRVSQNRIQNFSGIEGMKNLKELSLGSNFLKGIGKGLGQNLEKLNLQKNRQITRMRNLSHLLNLKFLDLSNCKITKIQGLKGLKNLEKLYLQGNEIAKLEGLNSQAKSLRCLVVDENQLIANITYLKIFIDLRKVGLAGSRIQRLPDNLIPTLTGLNIANANLKLMGGIRRFSHLSSLNCSNNLIDKIVGTEDLRHLEKLFLSENKIERIKNLHSCTLLAELYLADNGIKKIEGLENLNQLRILDLENNDIENIEGLENNLNLSFINLGNNYIESLRGFGRIESKPFLKTVDLKFNEINFADEENVKLLNTMLYNGMNVILSEKAKTISASPDHETESIRKIEVTSAKISPSSQVPFGVAPSRAKPKKSTPSLKDIPKNLLRAGRTMLSKREQAERLKRKNEELELKVRGFQGEIIRYKALLAEVTEFAENKNREVKAKEGVIRELLNQSNQIVMNEGETTVLPPTFPEIENVRIVEQINANKEEELAEKYLEDDTDSDNEKENDVSTEPSVSTMEIQDGEKSETSNEFRGPSICEICQKRYWWEKRKPFGLRNLGMTCYINCSNFLEKVWENYSANPDNEICQIKKCQLIEFVGDVVFRGDQHPGNELNKLVDFIMDAGLGADRIGQQFDSHLFMENFIKSFVDEGIEMSDFEWAHLTFLFCSDCKELRKEFGRDTEEETSYFNIINTSFGSVEEKMKQKLTGIPLEDEKCRGCKGTNVLQADRVVRTPKAALIRFDRDVDDGPMKVDLGFSVPEIRIEKEVVQPETLYRLKGCVIHKGYSLKSGHYVAAIRKTDKKWYYISDSSVKLVDFKTVAKDLGQDEVGCRKSRCMVAYYERISPQSIYEELKEEFGNFREQAKKRFTSIRKQFNDNVIEFNELHEKSKALQGWKEKGLEYKELYEKTKQELEDMKEWDSKEGVQKEKVLEKRNKMKESLRDLESKD